ncbi:hypothetical protein [Desertivibrio insolitus]|uniref:hypothetical protein n=1 Tax=Herbiconiux sp. SYSU D00978 TaxID=2812562 RepID=UPI001A96FEE7|nr:hypothetical protein [Herbiconiux sp. SYSU D00978]
MRTLLRVTSAALLSASLVLPLAACSGGEGLVDNVVEGIVGDQIDQFSEGVQDQLRDALGGVDFTTDGALPDGFPADVPLVSDDVVRGGTAANGAGWAAQVRVADASAFADAQSLLEGAGYTASGVSADADAGFGIFTSTDYRVVLTVAQDGDAVVATYVVTPA